MPIAANATGSHSTLDVILGAGILIWALGSATAMFAWIAKLAHRRSRRRGTVASRGRPVRPVLRFVPAAGTSITAAVDQGGGTPAVFAPRWNELHAEARNVGNSAGAANPNATTGGLEAPVVEGPRCPPETLEPLSEHLDASHALALAEARVAQTLAALPASRWLVERYALVAGHRSLFPALGGTGVY